MITNSEPSRALCTNQDFFPYPDTSGGIISEYIQPNTFRSSGMQMI